MVLVAGCGWQGPPENAATAKQGPRDRPDDSDSALLVPGGAETVIEVDLEALRRSPWTAEALTDPDTRLRERKAAALGYDGPADVDRIVYAVTSAGVDAPTIVIAQGRFQTANVEAAFRDRWANAGVDKWRGLTTLSSGENGLGTLTPRDVLFGATRPGSGRHRLGVRRGAQLLGRHGGQDWDWRAGVLRRQLLAAARFTSPAIRTTVILDDKLRAWATPFRYRPSRARWRRGSIWGRRWTCRWWGAWTRRRRRRSWRGDEPAADGTARRAWRSA